MTIYQDFIGIDIGKFNFVINCYGSKSTKEYDNNQIGIKNFIKDFKAKILNSLIILETTGGYEMELLLTLCNKKFAVHRANTRKVKNFIRSLGNSAKTDPLDAKALALYGFERHSRLELFIPASNNLLDLYQLVQRRKDLKKMLVAEKNRLKAPMGELVKESCQIMIDTINSQIKQIDAVIDQLIAADPNLTARKQMLKTIPGIGDIIAAELLILLPELGTLTRRQIASLAGVAPKANDSGKFSGYRHTNHGRDGIKPMLFLAAMAARNSNSQLKTFYNRLIEKGKKKMVALTALMRKIIVIANARIAALTILKT